MKFRKNCMLLLVLSLCVLLCACDFSGMFNRGQSEPQQENGRVLRETWDFVSDGSCYIETDALYYDGSQWQVDSYGTNAGGYISYINGQMCVEIGPDVYGIYDVTVSGDTMQVHYFDWEGREINATFNRYTGDEVSLP